MFRGGHRTKRRYDVTMKTMIGWGVAGAVLAGGLIAGCKTTRAGYESAPYKVVRKDGKFELRDYPALQWVETDMTRRTDTGNGSFGRLFNYISGQNAAERKIAMTTPVFMAGKETNATMAFVMPAEMATQDVPRPADTAVRVREVPGGRFAVFRFSGGRSGENETAALRKLEAWLSGQGMQAITNEPVYGYFDPPWTPGFLRRNEVMLRVGK
jgi:DNA gyrase inhibitor GyrI